MWQNTSMESDNSTNPASGWRKVVGTALNALNKKPVRWLSAAIIACVILFALVGALAIYEIIQWQPQSP
ncbi:MAG: hypothetical protein OD811_05565 [Alphaproteobacteria bacterium]